MEKENKKIKKTALKWKKLAIKMEKERDEYLDYLKRARADLVNYKNKENERTEESVEREKKKLFLEIINIIDNFERASEEVEKKDEKDEIIVGILKTQKQLKKILKDEGVSEIESVGREFDPHYHDAIEVTEDSDKESGIITEELQKGYMFKDKIIRSSKVKVVK